MANPAKLLLPIISLLVIAGAMAGCLQTGEASLLPLISVEASAAPTPES
jgi:hypothetical protein